MPCQTSKVLRACVALREKNSRYACPTAEWLHTQRVSQRWRPARVHTNQREGGHSSGARRASAHRAQQLVKRQAQQHARRYERCWRLKHVHHPHERGVHVLVGL